MIYGLRKQILTFAIYKIDIKNFAQIFCFCFILFPYICKNVFLLFNIIKLKIFNRLNIKLLLFIFLLLTIVIYYS